jgi:hypothetical protein
MKRSGLIYSLVLAAVVLLSACSDHSSPTSMHSLAQQALQKKQFVWNAMNYWYYWQTDVPQLADNHSHFRNNQAFRDYLASFVNPDSLFQSLRYKPHIVDNFSFFIKNYKKYNRQSRGIFAALGFEYGYIELADNYTIVGYVQYIIPGSPAAKAGLKRGEVFTKVDGTSLNISNYQNILRSQSAHTLTMAIDKNGRIKETGEKVTVKSKRLTRNPVFYHTVINEKNIKIGYLVYNAFHTNSHKALNKVFGTFKSKNINTLILDLRYNGGGALITARLLGSIISGEGSSAKFAELRFNKKRAAQNDTTVNFLNKLPIINKQGKIINRSEPINKLAISDVYILIGQGTASASEALINALEPYMHVVLIGTKTIGKNHGEITLYNEDPPYTDVKKADHNTKFALSPMLFKIVNPKNKTIPNDDYSGGFKPDYRVNELNYLDHLPPLGSIKDPLVRKAISLIIGTSRRAVKPQARFAGGTFRGRLINSSRELRPHGARMTLLPGMLHISRR